jgi:carboxypeptidase Taq
MNKFQKIFNDLLNENEKIATYKGILKLLNWDQETYLPYGAIDVRAHQIAELSTLIHKMETANKVKNKLEQLISFKTNKFKTKHLTSVQKKSIELLKYDFLRLKKLPSKFIHKVAKTTSSATNAWAIARQQGKYDIFSPYLEKIIDFNLEKADLLGYDEHPYDAHISQFEPYMTTKKLHTFFKELKPAIKNLLLKIQKKPKPEISFLNESFPKDKQRLLGNTLLDHLNLGSNNSRMDESNHPFSIGIHPKDVRITTRIEHNFLSNILSILHECGHAFYERNLPVEYFGSPLCDSTSLSIHESQSRFWEVFIGRCYSFWEFFYPYVKDIFPNTFKEISLKTFYRAIHKVGPSFIRVDSDELTYCLHIILRFELELEMLNKKIKAQDLPSAWNQKVHEFLGIKPSNFKEGCLQDIHWSFGEFGYFPTYALGNVIAAQLFESFKHEFLNWEENISKGNFSFIKEWLKSNIHQHGRFFSMSELVEKTTKVPLTTKFYIDYLTNKYSKIYNL